MNSLVRRLPAKRSAGRATKIYNLIYGINTNVQNMMSVGQVFDEQEALFEVSDKISQGVIMLSKC
jgi:hypothetical protein